MSATVFELPPLPFAANALEPIISRETIQFHYEKHHRGYVEKLNKLVVGSQYEDATLEEIVREATGPIYEQAAQHWNHSFYWKSIDPLKQKLNSNGVLGKNLLRDFGGLDYFKTEFDEMAGKLFGSGWLWLISDAAGAITITPSKDAGNPLRDNQTPLFVCDLWEHAYYIDYRNRRAEYVTHFFDLINWEFAEQNFIKSVEIQPHQQKDLHLY